MPSVVPAGYATVPLQGLTKLDDMSGPYILDSSGNPFLLGQGNVASGTADSGNPVKIGAVYNAVKPVIASGQRGDAQIDLSGNLNVRVHGSSTTGADGIANSALSCTAIPTDANSTSNRPMTIANYRFNGTSWDRDAKASAVARLPVSAASTNATSAKASAGTVHNLDVYNANAAVRYLKLYNKASAPVVGTDTPVRTIALKPADKTVVTFPNGLYFSTGIAYALTTGAADSDTGVVGTDISGLNIDYA